MGSDRTSDGGYTRADMIQCSCRKIAREPVTETEEKDEGKPNMEIDVSDHIHSPAVNSRYTADGNEEPNI